MSTMQKIESAITQLDAQGLRALVKWLQDYRARKADTGSQRHRFASASLIGCLRSGIEDNDNATFRRALSQQLNEKNR